jgi:hypothetical protein
MLELCCNGLMGFDTLLGPLIRAGHFLSIDGEGGCTCLASVGENLRRNGNAAVPVA